MRNPLAKIIHDSGVPIEDIAKACECTEAAINNYLLGRNAPTRSKYPMLAQALRVPTSKVAEASTVLRKNIAAGGGRSGQVKVVKINSATLEDEVLDVMALAMEIHKLDPQFRDTVREMVAGLARRGA